MLRINKLNLKTEVEMILEKYSLPESSVGTVPFDKSPPDSGKVLRDIWKVSPYIGMEGWANTNTTNNNNNKKLKK